MSPTRRNLIAALAILSAPLPAAVPAKAQSNMMKVYGPGDISCATYLQDRSIRINADGWILGFWTGSNRTAEVKSVGSSTDARGIVGEVAKFCRDAPSTNLFEAEKKVYDRMKADGR